MSYMENQSLFCEQEGKIVKPTETEKRVVDLSISQAIAEGIGEYRRQIAQIRARHGRQNRKSLHAELN
jgi:hypothetical protein